MFDLDVLLAQVVQGALHPARAYWAASRAVWTHEIQFDHLERHILPVLDKERLQKLSPAHLRRLFDGLNRAGLGASSQRQVRQFLISTLGDAQRLELVTRNVAEGVKPTPARGKEQGALPSFTAEEAAASVRPLDGNAPR